MSDLINEKILEQLFDKYLEQGFAENEAAKLAKKAQAAKSVPEKVSVLDTPICKTHTTFYAQQD